MVFIVGLMDALNMRENPVLLGVAVVYDKISLPIFT